MHKLWFINNLSSLLTLLFQFFSILCIFPVDWYSCLSPHLTVFLFLQECSVRDREQLSLYSLIPPEPLSSCWGGICLYSEFFFPVEDTNTVNTLKRDRWSLQRNANIMYIGQNSGVVLELIGLVRCWKVLYTSHNTNRTYNTENDTNWAVKQFDSFIICIYYTCSFYELILYN